MSKYFFVGPGGLDFWQISGPTVGMGRGNLDDFFWWEGLKKKIGALTDCLLNAPVSPGRNKPDRPR
jgi:hypothetical protein